MEKNNDIDINSSINISLMTSEDLQILENCLSIEFDEFWNYSILEQEVKNENTTYIVAKQNTELVGFAGLLTILDEATIMNIVTKKTKRNLGIGTLLLKELINIAKEKKQKSITLEVNENNLPAIQLYKKFNFQEVGIRKNYYNGTDTAILMTLYI